jgi:hypothetical protein
MSVLFLSWKFLFGCHSEFGFGQCMALLWQELARSSVRHGKSRVVFVLIYLGGFSFPFMVWMLPQPIFILFTLMVYFSVFIAPLGVQSVSLYVVYYWFSYVCLYVSLAQLYYFCVPSDPWTCGHRVCPGVGCNSMNYWQFHWISY